MSLINYLKDTRSELKHVNWPTRSEAVNYTIAVIVMAIVVALLLGLADFAFVHLLELFI